MRISNDTEKWAYKYLGKIAKVNGNYTYKIEWVEQGLYEDDSIGSISQRNIRYKFLKPYK